MNYGFERASFTRMGWRRDLELPHPQVAWYHSETCFRAIQGLMQTDISPESSAERLGSILLEAGLVSPGQMKEAVARKREQGGLLGKILVELGYIRQDDLISFLVKRCKIPHISLMDYQISPELFTLVPKEICISHWLLPIDRMGSILTVAMVDPLDSEALERVRAACPALRIKPILCSWQHYETAMRKFFPEQIKAPTDAQEVSLADFGLSAPAASSKKKLTPVEPPPGNRPEPIVEEVESVAVSGMPAPEAFAATIQYVVSAAIAPVLDRIADGLAGELARLGENSWTVSGRVGPILTQALESATDGMAETLLSKIQQALADRQTMVTAMTAEQLGDLIRRSVRHAIADATDAIARR